MQIAIKSNRPYTAPAEECSDNSGYTNPPVTTQTSLLFTLNLFITMSFFKQDSMCQKQHLLEVFFKMLIEAQPEVRSICL